MHHLLHVKLYMHQLHLDGVGQKGVLMYHLHQLHVHHLVVAQEESQNGPHLRPLCDHLKKVHGRVIPV